MTHAVSYRDGGIDMVDNGAYSREEAERRAMERKAFEFEPAGGEGGFDLDAANAAYDALSEEQRELLGQRYGLPPKMTTIESVEVLYPTED